MVKRRPTQDKRGKSNSSIVVLHKGVGLPPRLRTTLRVNATWNINHAGTSQTFGFTCNDPYRPCITFTTLEIPAYLTFLSQAYDRLFVISARIHLELINSNIVDSIATTMGYDSNLTGTPVFDNVAESRDAQSHSIGHFSGGSNKVSFNMRYTPEKYQALPHNSPDNICVAGAGPPNPYYWICAIQSIAGGSGNVGARVTIEYDTEFAELKLPSP